MKLRADEALVLSGLAGDLTRAQALIMEGKALYGSDKLLKAAQKIERPEMLRLKGEDCPYVSRGAYKLKKAFEVFDISVQNKVCIDVGASTGGFSDIMLQNGARKLYCVDVGYNLLDWKIRSDARVVVMEKTNARFLKAENFVEEIDFGASDVSFISLKSVLPTVFKILKPGADFITLVKPQFEAARDEVGEKGVVRDKNVHIKVLKDICAFLYEKHISVVGIDYSPIKGPEGNIEFLLHLTNDNLTKQLEYEAINAAVENAHVNL